MSKNQAKIVACLDIGTSKLVCLIASIESQTENSEINILGYGYRESKGIFAGTIVDMRLAQKAITDVICSAERMAGFNIDHLIVGLSGSQTLSQKKIIKSRITSKMVKNVDIVNLINNLRTAYKNNNREIIHLISLQYSIDGSAPVQNPRYMTGEVLSTKFHIICAPLTTTQNIENCLSKCHLSVHNYISEPYASALSCLNESELNLNTMVINIGGGETSYSIISDNKLMQIGNIKMGGNHITKDIATVLNIDFQTAENIKNLNNSLALNPVEEREIINIKLSDFDILDFSKITKKDLKEIIEARIEEILQSIKTKVEQNGFIFLNISNIVLTGGVANVLGIDKLAQNIFSKSTRIGIPQHINNLPEMFINPSFCCAFGMLVFIRNILLKEKISHNFNSKNNWFKKILDRLISA